MGSDPQAAIFRSPRGEGWTADPVRASVARMPATSSRSGSLGVRHPHTVGRPQGPPSSDGAENLELLASHHLAVTVGQPTRFDPR
jgi:hypothetical protein